MQQLMLEEIFIIGCTKEARLYSSIDYIDIDIVTWKKFFIHLTKCKNYGPDKKSEKMKFMVVSP